MSVWHQLATPLVRRALLEAVLVGALCGLVGVHVLLRRLPFFALAIAHSAFPGIAVASVIGVDLAVGGIASTSLLVVAVAVVGSIRTIDSSTATGVALAAAFALGVLVQSSGAGASKDLSALLVGDVFTVDRGDLIATALAAVAVVVVLAVVHKELVFSAFDPGGAAAAGLPVRGLEVLVLAVIAVTVVTAVPAVGTILVLTLLVAPALAARQWTERIGVMLALSAGLGALAGAIGIVVSAHWGVAGGASIVIVAVGEFALSVAGAALVSSRRPQARAGHPVGVQGVTVEEVAHVH